VPRDRYTSAIEFRAWPDARRRRVPGL